MLDIDIILSHLMERKNFSNWQGTVKDVLLLQVLLNALQSKKQEKIINKEWEEWKVRAISIICLSLTLEIKYSVLNEKSSSNL